MTLTKYNTHYLITYYSNLWRMVYESYFSGALCSFGEEILIRIERSLTEVFSKANSDFPYWGVGKCLKLLYAFSECISTRTSCTKIFFVNRSVFV